MRESYTASSYTSDTDLPKFEAAELRRVLELLESLAVTEPQKIARSHRLSCPPHWKRSERGLAPGREGGWQSPVSGLHGAVMFSLTGR